MRAVTLFVCSSLVVSVGTAGLLENLIDGLNKNMKKLEERLDSLMSKLSSHERQLQAEKNTNNAQEDKLSSLERQIEAESNTINEDTQGSLEQLLNEKMNKTEEKVASLMSKQQSIIEKQSSELNKTASLEDLTRKQKNTIDELSKESDDQARRLGQYEAGIKKQEEIINAQGSKLSSLERQVQAEKNTNTAQASQLTKLTTPQYFNVFLTGNENIAPGQVVVFDRVTDDPDHLYNSTTGEFKCKVPGLYVFTLNILSQNEDGDVYLNIIVNGFGRALTHANGYWDQASQTLTVDMMAGDVVKVLGNWKESKVYGGNYPFTTFSGRLVTPAK